MLILATLSISICVLAAAAQEPAVTRGEALEHLLTRVPPVYPPLARQARIMGSVQLTLSIDEKGNVTDVKVDSGHPMLTGSAVDAARQWKFRPFTADDEPVEVTAAVLINFTLNYSPEDLERGFQTDYPYQMKVARLEFSKGTPEQLSEAALDSAKALEIAHAAHRHPDGEARAQLLLARVHQAQAKDATKDFENALQLFREAEVQGKITDSDKDLADARFYAGENYFHSENFAAAEPPLQLALQTWITWGSVPFPERGAQIARAASMLAAANIQLGHPKAAEESCRVLKRYKKYLHGLELDQAMQACVWSR